jgi:hypothetical protein
MLRIKLNLAGDGFAYFYTIEIFNNLILVYFSFIVS